MPLREEALHGCEIEDLCTVSLDLEHPSIYDHIRKLLGIRTLILAS